MRWNCSADSLPCCRLRSARNNSAGRGQLPTVVTGNSGRAFPLKEQLLRDGPRQRGVARGATRQPRLQPFQVHHLAMRRVVITHPEQRIRPAFFLFFREAFEHGEVAVVERLRGSQHCEAVGIGRAVGQPRLPVQVEHGACVALAVLQAAQRVSLSSDMVSVLAHQHVKPTHAEVLPRPQSSLPEMMNGKQGRLRRIHRSGGDGFPAQVLQALRNVVLASQNVRDPVAVRVAHGDGAALAQGPPLRVHPGEGRIPGDVNVPRHQRVHLQLVIAVEHAIHGAALLLEKILDDLPDHRHLRIVDYGSHQDRGLCHSSSSTSYSSLPATSYGMTRNSIATSPQRRNVWNSGDRASVSRHNVSSAACSASALT